MRVRRALRGGERGVALVLTLMVLLTLTGLALALLSMSAFEPRISRNLSDAARARYLAEAGIEIGYNTLVTSAGADGAWSPLLAAATADRPWVALPSLSLATVPGLTAADGTFSVSIRNDWGAGDTAVPGEAPGGADAALDVSGVVIMRASGVFKGATRTVEVVVQRRASPPSPDGATRALCAMSNWREI